MPDDDTDSRFYRQRTMLDNAGILDFEYSGNMVRARFWTKYNKYGARFSVYYSRWHADVEGAVSEVHGEVKASLMIKCGVTTPDG